MKNTRIDRRQLLKLGASLAAGVTLSSRVISASADQDNAILRVIPSTGEQLPVIGVGTNSYSVTSAEDIASRREVLQNFPHLGCKVIDTAQVYGNAEVVIGNILQDIGGRDDYFLASKTPTGRDFPDPEAAIRTSLERMQVDRIDLMMIHSLAGLDELTPALIRAKEAGTLRYIGLSTSSRQQHPEVMEAMRKYPFDFVQVDYSIGNRGAADSVLPLAQDLGMAVMINTPFGGRNNAASIFNLVADLPLPDFASDIDVTSWAQLFLKFILVQPMVTAIIPGMTRLSHLEDNAGAGRGRVPDAALGREIERYWDSLDS